MKTASKTQIEELVTFFKDSAYAHVNEISDLAKELAEEGDEIEEVESSIFDQVDQYITDYSYIECECTRHIWHKN